MTELIAAFSYKTIQGKIPKGDPRLAQLAGGWSRSPNQTTVENLLSCIRAGNVVAPGVYQDNYKNQDNFERGQLVLMDFDDGVITWEQAKMHPFFMEHCIAAHTSSSHGINGAEKFHVIALLPSVATGSEAYNQQVRALREHLAGQDSAMTSDQCCYGNPFAEWVYYDNDNRLPVFEIKEKKRDVFDELDRLSTDSDDPYEVKVQKMKLCLNFIPMRISGEGTYNEAFDAACVLVNEFGVEEGFKIAEAANWLGDWDLYWKMVNLSNDRREGKAPLRLGSLVDLVRELLTGRYANAEFLEEFELRLEQINKSQVKLATSSELLEESKSSGQKIKELLDRVVELELDITRDTWSERQALMKQMQALGPNKQECKRRVFDHICDFFGVDLGATKGNTIVDKGRERARRLMNRSKGDWLVPGFLRQNRDAIFFGDSGSGKTTISLDMIRSLTMNRTFADGKQPCQGQKKTLFIATDGGVTAESVLMDYINDLGLMHHDQFWEKFIWWSSDEDSSSPPWTLTLGNMIKLQERLTEGDIDLVVIDSLKAVTTGTDYSIDDRNIGHVMRLMQSIVTPHAGLVWIHHTNKSGKSSSHSAGGVTDIIEVVSAAFQVQREWEDDKPTQRSTMKVQKLRGEDSRQFNFTFDWRHGVCPEIEMDYEAREIEARVTDYPQMIMVAIRDSEFGRMSRGSLSDAIGASANTVDNYLQELKKSGLIKQARSKGWCLTGKGTQVAENFSRKRLESQLSSDF